MTATDPLTPPAPRRILRCPRCGRGHNPPPAGKRTPRLCGGCRGGFAPPRPAGVDFRLPLAPLVEAMGCTPWQAMERLRVWGPDWKDYTERGVTLRVADRLAVRAGFTVDYVWPSWQLDRHRFTNRARVRRQRLSTTGRIRHRERAARYYAEAGDYVRAAQRRRYAEKRGAA